MKILIFGAPGVGKGTQAKILSKKLHIPHISTGDILRAAANSKTELGLKAKAIMDAGELVPDDVMGGIIKETLNDEKTRSGFILDGFPRTIEQAEILNKVLNELGENHLILISIAADDELIINRLSERRECTVCHTIVNLIFLNDENVCPNCGSKDTFIKRKDDDADVIKNRLKVFHRNTAPVLSFYEDKAKLINVDGTKPVEQVTDDILNQLNLN